MKKLAFFLLAALLLLSGCGFEPSILDSLPSYRDREFYTEGAFQDYTDYGKYYYDGITEEMLARNPHFSKVTAVEVDLLLLLLDDFENWVEVIGEDSELSAHYDLDRSVIAEGDYVHIEAEKLDTFSDGSIVWASYSVYYFDWDSNILYYFHNNI